MAHANGLHTWND